MKKYKVCIKERLNNSTNGNPRYKLMLQDVETGEYIQCKTKSDYSYNYVIDNPGYRDYLYAELTYTRTGNCYIDDIEPAE